MRGRKPTQETRAAEFPQRLIAWKQSPEGSRPSLRALALQIDTSQQRLKHYLDELEKSRYKGRYCEATEESDQILAGAYLDNRPLTEPEKQRVHDCTMASLRARAASDFLDKIEQIKQDAKRGPLHPAQVKMVKILAKQGFPGAQGLLQKSSQVGVKERKPFAEIVKETPRQDGEAYIIWVRRIGDQAISTAPNAPR